MLIGFVLLMTESTGSPSLTSLCFRSISGYLEHMYNTLNK